MKSRSIVQKVFFNAPPNEVFGALMDSKKHSAFTGSKCVVGKGAGDSFSTYDGYSAGKNLRIVPDKLIVQLWRAGDWPEGHFSEIVFELKKAPGGTVLRFTQKNLPEGSVKEFADGWKEFYWKPLKAYLEK